MIGENYKSFATFESNPVQSKALNVLAQVPCAVP